MYLVGLVIFSFFLCMATGVLYAFYWAAQDGQMRRLEAGARVIFDQEEGIGAVTDLFPDKKGLPRKDSFVVSLPKIKL